MKWNKAAVAAAAPVAAVAVIAGIVSYSHICALGLANGQSSADAHMLPLAVDGLIVAGSVILLAKSNLGWLGVVPGVAATLFANLESGLPHGRLAATLASWPAVAFTVASFMLERWLKAQVGEGGQGGRRWPENGAESTPIAELPAEDLATPDQVAAEWPERMSATHGLPELPEPVPATPEPCRHNVAGPPAEAVVNAFLHGRDCLGETPSQRALAATYGVHRSKVAELVKSCNGTEVA